jgi:hypothetical protein
MQSIPPTAGIGAVRFLQETDLVKLEYAVNDVIEGALVAGATVLSVVMCPLFVYLPGEHAGMEYFATVTFSASDPDEE